MMVRVYQIPILSRAFDLLPQKLKIFLNNSFITKNAEYSVIVWNLYREGKVLLKKTTCLGFHGRYAQLHKELN